MAGIRAQRKQETRLAIIDAGVQLFGTKGYDRTSMEDIATAAGIGKGTIYGYFAAKQEIFLAFCDEEVERSFRILRESVDPEAPLLQQLVTLFMLQFRFVTKNREFGRHMLREMAFPRVSSPATLEHDQRYLDMLEGLLEKAQERGAIKADALLPTASASFYLLYLGCLSGWYGGYWATEQDLEEAMQRLFRQVLEGIGS